MLGRIRVVRGRIREGYYSFLKPRRAARLAHLYALDRLARRRYRSLSAAELRATRSSDTAFVFGSGRSLVEITDDEWARIERCNTISLREFPRQDWVRADYHVSSEVDHLEEYAARIRENARYAQTVFVVQEGFQAERGNELVGRRLLPEEARVFRFRRRARGVSAPPSPSLERGLTHGYSSIFDATNLAILLGFTRIVLVGVDLYNKEYFWLSPGETRTYEKPGEQATRAFAAAGPIVEMLGDWHDLLSRRGVELSVYDGRSLAASRLPVFRR